LAINGRRGADGSLPSRGGRAIDGGGVTEGEVKEERSGRCSTAP
jgi:hypothetical protein